MKDRIKAIAIDGDRPFTRVHGAAEFAAAIQRAQFTDEAFVMLSDVSTNPNTLMNAMSQVVTDRYLVAQWVRNAGDATGGKAADDLDTRRAAVIAQLLNWVPAADHDPFEYVGGRLLQYQTGAILWADEFRTRYLARKTS